MVDDDGFAQWIRRLASGDPAAEQEAWQRYYTRLVGLARRWLGSGNRRVADESDVALSAMHSFYRGIATGRFPCLDDPQDLWRLLMTITARKAMKQLTRQKAKKRGGGQVRGESALAPGGPDQPGAGIEQVMGNEPTPALAAIAAEECDRLLDCLEDDSFREIALAKLEGYSNEEIARRMDCSLRTVKRRLARIREKWSELDPQQS